MSVRALLVVDNEPIRREAMRALNEAQVELDDLTRQFAVFRERDKPLYSSWLMRTFSSILSEIQEIGWKIHERRSFVEAVLREAAHSDIPFAEAYERLEAGQAQAPGNEAWGAPSAAEDDEESDDEAVRELFVEDLQARGINPDELDPEELEERYEAFRREHGFDEGWEESHEDREAFSESPPSAEKSPRLKDLYRRLARMLHPDVVGEKGGQQSHSLWLQVQAAYDSGDLGRLEGIFLMLEGKGGPPKESLASISEIREAMAQLMASIQAMRRRIRNAHRDRAWGFSKTGRNPRKKRVYRMVRQEMEAELREAQETLDAIDEFIEACLRRAA